MPDRARRAKSRATCALSLLGPRGPRPSQTQEEALVNMEAAQPAPSMAPSRRRGHSVCVRAGRLPGTASSVLLLKGPP